MSLFRGAIQAVLAGGYSILFVIQVIALLFWIVIGVAFIIGLVGAVLGKELAAMIVLVALLYSPIYVYKKVMK